MLFTILIILMTCIILALIGVWLARPDLRQWMEKPKYQMLEQLDRFDRS